jgi:hypothetical protein
MHHPPAAPLGRYTLHPLAFSAVLILASCRDDSAPLEVDTSPPTLSLSLNSQDFSAPGTLSLTVAAEDNVSVARVEFYERIAGADPDPSKIAEDASEPYGVERPFLSAADDGNYEFTAKAYDAAGNVGTSSVATVTVNLEGAPSTFTISASHNRITTPGQITFSAEPVGGLSRLEIYEGGHQSRSLPPTTVAGSMLRKASAVPAR